MKIAVAGIGYVGLSNAVILAQHHQVRAVDLDPSRVELVNRRISPVVDAELSEHLAAGNFYLHAITDAPAAYAGAKFVVVATPTDYDPVAHHFDTRSVRR